MTDMYFVQERRNIRCINIYLENISSIFKELRSTNVHYFYVSILITNVFQMESSIPFGAISCIAKLLLKRCKH